MRLFFFAVSLLTVCQNKDLPENDSSENIIRAVTGAIDEERAHVRNENPFHVTEGDSYDNTIPSIKAAIKLITKFETSHPCTK